MPTVVGVKLRFSPKALWFDPEGIDPAEGDLVIVTTERGTELGTVVQTAHEVEESDLAAPLKPVNRIADAADLARADELAILERDALPVVRRMIADHGLDMKPVDVEYLFGGDKVVIYFVAEERVDFRELVKELASRFHARIDMRQVGVRDEARMVGGVGHCGQQLCCARFGGDFQPVSIRMAKEQDLPLNPLKISGLCGRLMCCLRYEFEAYKDFKSRAPRRGAIVETPLGLAKVADYDTPRETVDMRFEDGKRFTVPLADMHCCKGSGCPCAVSREVLEASGGTATTLALAVMEREAEAKTRAQTLAEAPAPAPVPASAEAAETRGDGGRRRRRRAGAPAGEGAAEAPAVQVDAAARPERPAERQRKPQPKAQKAPQRGSKPTGAQGAEAKQSPEAAQPEGEPGATRSTRRRRRRRSGSGGANAGGSAPAE